MKRPPPPVKFVNLGSLSLVMLCLGSLYAYSNYVPELNQLYHYSQVQLQTVFGAALAVFALTSLFTPHLLTRIGHRYSFYLSALLFGLGYLVVGFGGSHFTALLLGFSVIAGMGSGVGYIAAMYSCMQISFARPGLAMGSTVASFAAGAILQSNLIEALLSSGVGVLTIFGGVGVVCAGVIAWAGSRVRVELRREAVKFNRVLASVRQHRRLLIISIVSMVLGVFPGLTLLGALKVLALQVSSAKVVLFCVPFFALGNLSGRLGGGWLFDRFRIKGTILVFISLLSLFFELLLLLVGGLAWGYLTAVLLAALAYGFNFSFFPLYLRKLSGSEDTKILYPIVFFAQGSSALLVGPVAGLCLQTAYPRISLALLGGTAALLGLLLALRAHRWEEKRRLLRH